MEFTVVIPFMSECRHRQRALGWTVAHYEEAGFPVVVAGAVPFTKGAAAHNGVAIAESEGLIVTDGDVFVEGGIGPAVDAVRAGAPWAQPHNIVVRLSRTSTEQLYGDDTPRTRVTRTNWQRPQTGYPAPPGGGVIVLSRRAWDLSGGIDQRFVGFGGDDISWARALDTLAGTGLHLGARLFHLWHPRTPRYPGNRGSPDNERLAGAYLDAHENPDAMRRVIESRP